MNDIPIELQGALRNMRAVRSRRPQGEECSLELAQWNQEMGDVMQSLSVVLLFDSDRESAEKSAARFYAESERIRSAIEISESGSEG